MLFLSAHYEPVLPETSPASDFTQTPFLARRRRVYQELTHLTRFPLDPSDMASLEI
jgi:hypothetical protein